MTTCQEIVKDRCQSRLDDIKCYLNPSKDDVQLTDDGTLDTVLSIGDVEYRLTDTSAYRDDDGTLDLDSLIEDEWDGICETVYESFNDYGLEWVYVAPDDDQLEGYYRFLISWGGPSQEIRFFHSKPARVPFPDEQASHRPYKIEFWHMDWFDGASHNITNDDTAIALWNYLTCDGDVLPE